MTNPQEAIMRAKIDHLNEQKSQGDTDRDRRIFDSQPPNPRSMAATMHGQAMDALKRFEERGDTLRAELMARVSRDLRIIAWSPRLDSTDG